MANKQEYPSFISEKRRPVNPPSMLINCGIAEFGTYNAPLPVMNLLECHKPAGQLVPDALKKFRLTVWEAFEVNLKEGTLLCAVYNVGAAGFSIFVFYDKRTKQVYQWFNPAPAFKSNVAENLINSKTELNFLNSSLVMENQFQNGMCHGKGKSYNKKFGQIEFDIKITSLAPPSVVSIPLGENKPLYSHKEFFKAEGYLKLNTETFTTDDSSTAIVDDHKGFYAYNMHYDWLTTMGKTMINGEEKYLGFNLTQNQTTDADDYNENLLWLEDYSCPLPPVYFTHINDKKWVVRDEHDMVNVEFTIGDKFQMQHHFGVLDISYDLPFGSIKGYVKDIEGNKYCVDGMLGIGEDRSQRL